MDGLAFSLIPRALAGTAAEPTSLQPLSPAEAAALRAWWQREAFSNQADAVEAIFMRMLEILPRDRWCK
jgi:hypothetical protein